VITLRKREIYLLIFFIGVICAAYFIWMGEEYRSLLSTAATVQELPDPSPATASVHSSMAYPVFPATDTTLYQMGLYLDISDRTLYGSTILQTKNTAGQALNDLWFTVYPNAFRDAKTTPAPAEAYYAGFNEGWMEVEECQVNDKPVEFFLEGVSLQLIMEQDIMPEADIKIELKWQARIPKLAYRYGSKDGVFMLGNFYPTLNVLDEDGWHNSYNSVFGDPFCFNTADYLLRINIPEAYDIASTGINTQTIAEDNGRETYIVEAKNVRDFCLLVMYDYNELREKANSTTLKAYFPGGGDETVSRIIKKSGEILNYYSCKWGSYPYQDFKVAFVPMKGFHGMEYSGLIFLREEFLQPDFDQERSDFILAHEIAHQWWYGMVGNDQLREPWLDEGLANWSAYKYLEAYGGKAPVDRGTEPEVNLARELRDIYSSSDYYLTAYSGGEAFWFGLEKELGEENIDKVLRRYLADYRFKIAATQDLLTVIKKEAHKDMDDYFAKWFGPRK